MGFNKFIANEENLSLNEASFSAKNLEKVVKLISKLAAKKIGGTPKPLGVENFKRKGGAGGQGIGFRTMIKSGRMLRFNWEKGSKSQFVISSIDFWEAGDSFTKPKRTVKLAATLNIVQVVDKVMDALLTGKVNEEVSTEIEQLSPELATQLDEARSRSVEDAAEWLAAHGLPDSLKWSENKIKARAQKEGLVSELEVFLGVEETNSFEDAIKVKEKAFSSQIYANPDTVFDDLEDLTSVVAMGKQNSLIVAGMGGTGKTFHVEKIMKKMHGAPGKTWVHFKGLKSSPFGLFFNMFLNRDKVIVFDDSDSVMGDKDMVNMFKSALDTYENRPISWQSKATLNVSNMTPEEQAEYLTKLDEADPAKLGTKGFELPSTFNFTGKVIFISNLTSDKFDDAIKSRSLFIDIYLHQTDFLRRIETIAGASGDSEEQIDEIMGALGSSRTNRSDDIITYMTADKARESKTITMRAYQVAKALKSAGLDNWAYLTSMYA